MTGDADRQRAIDDARAEASHAAERAARKAAARAARRAAAVIGDAGMSLELRTTVARRLLLSPLALALLALALAAFGAAVALLAARPPEPGLRRLHYGGAGLAAVIGSIAAAAWLRRRRAAPIGVRVTPSGDAELFRGGELLGTCATADVSIRVIDRAAAAGRDRRVGECAITAAGVEALATDNRVFGLSERDVAEVERFARRHEMMFSRDS